MSESDFVMLIVGVSAFAGILGAWAFQKLRIPQIVGYIVIGVISGDIGFGLIHTQHIESLRSFNLLALGVIGFLVGGELKISEFKKYFRQFMAMLFGEGIGAFVLVGLVVGAIVYQVSHSVTAAVSAGVVLGAIASATDPASTIDVLWEYRCKGRFTTAVIAIIALDDALAMTLYGIGKGAAQILTGGGGSIATELSIVGKEIGGALLLGVVVGYVLSMLLRRLLEKERKLAISIGAILLIVGVAAVLDFDVILAAMTAGFLTTNIEQKRSADLFSLLRSFSIPIYVLFFVLIGARLNIGATPPWIWALVVGYVICRSLGKIGGMYLGAKISGAARSIRRYGGLALFTQGGVAVGLSIMASAHLRSTMLTPEISLGDAIIFTVTATTLIVQLIGPPLTKLAAIKADEIGRNITEEDIISAWTVADALSGRKLPAAVRENEPVENLLRRFADSDFTALAVVNAQKKAIGTITLVGMREIIAEHDCWRWLVAADVLRPIEDEILYPETRLTAAVEMLSDSKSGEILAVNADGTPFGIINERIIRQVISEEIFINRQKNDTTKHLPTTV